MSETLELGNLPKGHVSYSMYAMYLRCPKQFEYRYIEGIKDPPTSSMILGRSTHKGLEWSYKQQLLFDRVEHLNNVQAMAVEDMETSLKEVPPSEVVWKEGDSLGTLKDASAQLLEVYNPYRLKMKPLNVEEAFEIPFSNVDYTLVGRVDLQTKKAIIDYKTTARTPSLDAVEKSSQLALYQLSKPESKRLELHFLVRKKEPEVHIQITQPNFQKTRDVLENLGKTVTLIKTGIFPKALEDAPNSPCSWCGYYERCRGKKRNS